MLYPAGFAPTPGWICIALAEADDPRGGLIGLTTGAWLTIDLLWLPVELRGRGVGARLVAAAEGEAAAQGCIGAMVVTTSLEARRFYERQGYAVRLELPELQPGITQTTLQKTFARP